MAHFYLRFRFDAALKVDVDITVTQLHEILHEKPVLPLLKARGPQIVSRVYELYEPF